jgi:hypothetical protein
MSKPSNVHLYIAASIACLTASLFGYSVGFIGGVLVLPSFLRSFHLNKLPPNELASVESQIVTLWLLGALFGVPLGMPVCSRLGRKSCLLLSALLYVLGAAMQPKRKSWSLRGRAATQRLGCRRWHTGLAHLVSHIPYANAGVRGCKANVALRQHIRNIYTF